MKTAHETNNEPLKTDAIILFPEEKIAAHKNGKNLAERFVERAVFAQVENETLGDLIDLSVFGNFVKKIYKPLQESIIKPHKLSSSLLSQFQPRFNLPLISQARSVVNDQVRVVDVGMINKLLHGLKDPFEEYWRQKRNKKNFEGDVQALNSLIANLKPLAVLPSEKSGGENIHVSALQSLIVEAPLTEEPGVDTDDNNDKKVGQTSFSQTYESSRNFCQIDDLQQLVTTSTKLKDALKTPSSEKYADPTFLPSIESLEGFKESKSIPVDISKKIVWKRPEQFLGTRKISVYEEIDPNDIRQGGLGDCYFLAACSAIAEYPHRLERIFLTKTPFSQGIYALALCLDGVWEEVVMDDWVPCRVQDGRPAYNYTKNGELWVILAEKAWAKVHGGYYNISAGLTREALRDLTGASAKTFFTVQNPDALWERLIEANNNKWILTAGSANLSSGSDALIESVGIAGSHAYALLHVQSITTAEGNTERLLKLRNPWGTGEWKGRWNDKASEWTPALRQQLQAFDADDGCFYIPWKDFLEYFSDVQICYYHDNYSYTAAKVCSEKSESIFLKVSIFQAGLYYFSVNQKNRRKFRVTRNYKYSPFKMLIAKINPSTGAMEYVGAGMREDKENWIAAELPKGLVYVVIYTTWKTPNINEFSLSVYGPSKALIEHVKEQEIPKNFITHIFTTHARTDKNLEMISMEKNQLKGLFYKFWESQQGFGYIFFSNENSDVAAEIVVELTGSVNINTMPPFDGLRPAVTVPPRGTAIVVYAACNIEYCAKIRFMGKLVPVNMEANIIPTIIKNGTTYKKRIKLQDYDSFMYLLNTPDSLYVLYENPSSTSTVSEQVQFNLQNARVAGQYGNHVEISLPPRSRKLVKVVRENSALPFNVSIKNMIYKIISE